MYTNIDSIHPTNYVHKEINYLSPIMYTQYILLIVYKRYAVCLAIKYLQWVLFIKYGFRITVPFVMWSFDVFVDVNLNKQCQWFQTP